MCGRFSLTTPLEMLIEVFDLPVPGFAVEPRYNIAPTQSIAVVPGDEPKRLEKQRWGLIPHWTKDPSIGSRMINARGETLRDKPSFRGLLGTHRCLILADGFFEWNKLGRQRIPHRFILADGAPFAFAGLWTRWSGPGQAPILSCTIITTAANDLVAPVHERMPVILGAEARHRWLCPGELTQRQLAEILVPFPAAQMDGFQVSSRVNAVQFDDPACLTRLPTQRSLAE